MSKKMKLIPHLEYEKLISSKTAPQLLHKNAVVSLFNRKEAATNELLNLESVSDDIKLALFNSTVKTLRASFQELIHTPMQVEVSNMDAFKDKKDEQKFDRETSTDRSYFTSNLIHILPEKYRPAAKKVTEFLSNSKDNEVTWDESGQIYFKGVQRKGANIVDLLSYVVKPPNQAMSKKPVGIKTFLYILKKLKVPVTLLGIHIKKSLNSTAEKLQDQRTPYVENEEAANEDADYETDEESVSEECPDNAHFKTPPTVTKWKSFG